MCFPLQQYDKLLIRVLEIQFQAEDLDAISMNIKNRHK
jgi:hypothetical protein